MQYVDPHIHMVSRVTDDYKRMALAGLRAGQRAGVLGGIRPLGRRKAFATIFAS